MVSREEGMRGSIWTGHPLERTRLVERWHPGRWSGGMEGCWSLGGFRGSFLLLCNPACGRATLAAAVPWGVELCEW